MQSVVENNLKFGPDIVWPKDFPELKLLDECLRCGICYDYFKTVMVTPCAHSYCSICIRKYLSYKTACPICFEEIFETSLRNNRILDRVVDLFSCIRDKLIKHLKIAAIHFDCNEKSASPLTSVQRNTSQKTVLPSETPKNKKLVSKATSSKGKLNFSSLSTPSTSTSFKKSEISKRLEDILGSPSTNEPLCTNYLDSVHPNLKDDCEVNVPTVPSMFLKEPQPNQNQARSDMPCVSCPVCSVDIPERNINTHLDNCLANVEKPIRSPLKKKLKRNPLPKMVWHMMAEKDLRKKLKEYGLNTQGDKRALISRIQRYIVLYNSECDSENPRSIPDIIRQIEREEKQVPVQTLQKLVQKKDPKIMEVENKKYIEENKNNFNKLIEAMRQREGRNIKPLRPLNRFSSGSSDEDDDNKKRKDEPNQGNGPTKSCEKMQDFVNLCDSRSSSPVLRSWAKDKHKKIANDLPSDSPEHNEILSEDSSSEDIFLPEQVNSHKTVTPEKNKVFCNDIEGSPIKVSALDVGSFDFEGSASKVSALDARSDDFCDAEALFHSSPSRPPSPSCIITARSDCDSDDSISILINQNVDDNILDDVEPATENADPGPSQLCDPDFVLDTEDQEQGDSEEVFVARKSKRKHKNTVVSEIPSPRRTRRRLSKE